MTDPLAQAVADVERLETELLTAAAHLRNCKVHLQGREVPRYAAHLLATQGHLHNAQGLLTELAKAHASRARPNPEYIP